MEEEKKEIEGGTGVQNSAAQDSEELGDTPKASEDASTETESVPSDEQSQRQESLPTTKRQETDEDVARAWWESYWKQQEEKAEKEKKEQTIALERKRMAQSLQDIGQLFGDVIMASGGAVVLPRDIQKQYESLDSRQKTIFDTYNAKMEQLRQERMAAKMLEEKERRTEAAEKRKMQATLDQNLELLEAQKDKRLAELEAQNAYLLEQIAARGKEARETEKAKPKKAGGTNTGTGTNNPTDNQLFK